jgi:hypothetical protein
VVTGRTLPKPIWVVQLRGAKKQHLVASDEFGEPYKRTLSRKTYTLEDRTYSKKIKSLSGGECAACLTQLDTRLYPLKRGVRKLTLR